MYAVSIVVFSDAGKSAKSGQLCHIAGLLLGPLHANSTFRVISWSSDKACYSAKSNGTAETHAAGKEIDIAKALVKIYERILQIPFEVDIVVDSKDLFTNVSIKRKCRDKSIRGDVVVIRSEFETKAVSKFLWVLE